MKILVVGSGGREHAIIMKLSESKRVSKLYCAPGNAGISKFAECRDVKAIDISGMIQLAKQLEIDIVVVAPDDPLVLGMVDEMNNAGIKTFGPSKLAAEIEGSKVFSKNLMKSYNIPTAGYKVFFNAEQAIKYIKEQNSYPTVIKADGLALGKGVVIAENFEQANDAVISMMQDKIFGDSGSKIVIEEFLTGTEVSVLAFCDGKTVVPMVSSMDHKRAYDNDEGLNTGGMGTIAPSPVYTSEIAKMCEDTIFKPTVAAMASEGRAFKGCLYFGIILTEKGPKVIEYNCRFGDPETQVVLPLLETDLADIFEAIWQEKLSEIKISWKPQSAACVIMASGGYPKKYSTGHEINGLDENGQVSDNEFVFHAGTKLENGKIITAGGRVLGVTAIGENLKTALKKAYSSVDKIQFENAHFRTDIGKKVL